MNGSLKRDFKDLKVCLNEHLSGGMGAGKLGDYMRIQSHLCKLHHLPLGNSNGYNALGNLAVWNINKKSKSKFLSSKIWW